MKLSVVMPVFNESDSIREIIGRVLANPLVAELVVVDDKSVDGSRETIVTLAEHDERIKVILHGTNHGKGAAIRSGLAQCTGEAVIIQDADLEYDPNDYSKLIAPIEADEADVVYGSRYLGRGFSVDQSLPYRLANLGLTILSNRMTGLRLTDMETCYKCFRRDIIKSLELVENRFGVEVELTAKVAARGCRLREVAISYVGRTHNQGKKIGIRDGLEAVLCIFKYARRSKGNNKRWQ